MPIFDGKAVSDPWFVVLTAARKAGYRFGLNSGRRTMAKQQELYLNYLRTGWPLAAKPSPTAPHIREGRDDHALDLNGADEFDAFCTLHGFPLANTVPGEAWHKEIVGGEKALRDLARALEQQQDPTIRKGSTNREGIRRLQRLLVGLNLTRVENGKYGIWTRRAVRRFQRKHKLRVDGVVGPATWRALRRASNKGGS